MAACLWFIGLGDLYAQNRVPNPSFEDFDVCPQTIGFQPGGKPQQWEKWLWSPDYFNSCAGLLNDVDTVLDVPLNGFGFQYAFDGEGYVGMATYQDDYREYVGCELTSPLVVGETYYLSFQANVATGGNYWNPKLASNNLGLLFTMEPNVWTGLSGPSFPFRNYAHLHSEAILADTVNWVEVSGVFTADSAYRYLVIGNFFEDALTDTLGLEGFSTYAAYYFVDAVCVTTATEYCEFSTGIQDPDIHMPRLWPNPASDVLNINGLSGAYQIHDVLGRCVWQDGDHGSGGVGVDVSNWSLGRYVVRGNDGSFVQQFVLMR